MALTLPQKLVIVFSVFAALTIVCGVMTGVMPGIIEGVVYSTVALSDGSALYDDWVELPVPVYLQFWMYNCSNCFEWEENWNTGDKSMKPDMEQLGPYTYREYVRKENMEWDDDADTVTYDLMRRFEFLPEMSPGFSEDDKIILPNLPAIGLMHMARYGYGDGIQPGFVEAILPGLGVTSLFSVHTVGEFLFSGYRDPLTNMNTTLTPDGTFSAFGEKNDTSSGRYKVLRGHDNHKDFTRIIEWNGNSTVNWWKGDCNRINGTDSYQMAPGISKQDKLYIFNTDICRSLYLVYTKEVEHHDITTWRYEINQEVNGDYVMNPDNLCFCSPYFTKETCQDAGALHLMFCQKNAPVYMTGVHFYEGARKWMEGVDGVIPDPEWDRTFADVEPRTGLILAGGRKIQMNIYIESAEDYKLTKNIPNTMIPFLWVNESATADEATADRFKSMVVVPTKVAVILPLVLTCVFGAVTLGVTLYAWYLLLTKKEPSYATSNPYINGNQSEDRQSADLSQKRK